jgi:hypothetical protein
LISQIESANASSEIVVNLERAFKVNLRNLVI